MKEYSPLPPVSLYPTSAPTPSEKLPEVITLPALPRILNSLLRAGLIEVYLDRAGTVRFRPLPCEPDEEES